MSDQQQSLLTLLHAPIVETEEHEAAVYEKKQDTLEVVKQFRSRLQGALLLLPEKLEWEIKHDIGGYWATWREPQGARVHGHLSAHIEKLESWKELNPLFEALELVGVGTEKWASHDDAKSYTRIFTNENFFGGSVNLKIHATLKGDTEECRRVLIGYTEVGTQEAPPEPEPIYKLECGEANTDESDIPE